MLWSFSCVGFAHFDYQSGCRRRAWQRYKWPTEEGSSRMQIHAKFLRRLYLFRQSHKRLQSVVRMKEWNIWSWQVGWQRVARLNAFSSPYLGLLTLLRASQHCSLYDAQILMYLGSRGELASVNRHYSKNGEQDYLKEPKCRPYVVDHYLSRLIVQACFEPALQKQLAHLNHSLSQKKRRGGLCYSTAKDHSLELRGNIHFFHHFH